MTTYLPICNWDGHFWPRKKHLFYVAYGHSSIFDRWRLRFCTEHAAIIDEHLSERELGTADDTLARIKLAASQCFSCDEPLGEGAWQVFLTGYPTQDQRKDYWFQVHPNCSLPEYLRDGYSA